MPSDAIACPNCGAPMNHHADKLVYLDADGEALEKFYQCPHCGASLMREGSMSSNS